MPALVINPLVGRTLKRLFALAGLRSEFTVSVPGIISSIVFNVVLIEATYQETQIVIEKSNSPGSHQEICHGKVLASLCNAVMS